MMHSLLSVYLCFLFRWRKRTLYGLCNSVFLGVSIGNYDYLFWIWEKAIFQALLSCTICLLIITLGVSKNLGSLWEDLGKMMEGEDEIEIGQVDCGVSKSVCTKVDIHSYPTFKVFYDGEEVAKYQGNF